MVRKAFIRSMSLFLFTLIFILCFSLIPSAETAPPTVSNVDAFCVINAEHKKVVAQENMNKSVYPTSTVKLMTALVAVEHFADDLEDRITVTEEMLDAVVGRNLSLEVGEKIRVTDLLHAMLVGGYNDAAVILAHAVAGDVSAFCEKMNQKASSIGATNTHYTNPTGLHDDAMKTTAYDSALLGLAVLENSTVFDMTKRVKYTIPSTNKSDERIIYNRNALITTSMTEEYYYSYAEGMNSGATDEGGDCVITAGKLDGLSWVCVVMGGRPTSADDDTNHACVAAKNLLRHALISYEVKTLRSEKEIIHTIPVRFSATEESVDVKMAKDLSALLNVDVDLQNDISYEINITPDLMEAPIEEGTVVGSIQAVYQGKVIDSTELITASSIDSHGFLIFMYRFKKATQHPIFILLLLLSAGFGGYSLWKRAPFSGKKKDRRKRNRYF